MAKTEMRPIKDTIPLEEARQLIAEALPADRAPRARARSSMPTAASRRRRAVDARRAAVLARRHGRLRGRRRRHLRRQPLRAEDAARDREGLHRPGADASASSPAPPSRSPPARRCPHGADAVVMVEETEKAGDEVRILTPVYPRQNVGRQGADIVVGQTVMRAATC